MSRGQEWWKGGRLPDPSLVIHSSNTHLLSTHHVPGAGAQWQAKTTSLTNQQISRSVIEMIQVTDKCNADEHSEQGNVTVTGIG